MSGIPFTKDSTSIYNQMGANAITLPIFAILALLITCVPFLLLFRVRNLAGCTLIITIATINIMTAINSLLWPTNNWNSWYNGAVLCDIEVQIKAPLYTLIATSLCSITRALAKALDIDNSTLYESRAMKRRKLLVDVLFCFGIPFVQLALHYIVSNARFGISPVYGCLDFFDASWPTIIIMQLWPPLFCLMNTFYAVLVMIRLRQRRSDFVNTLSSTSSGLNPRSFLKLFMLSLIMLVIYLPLTAYYFYVDIPPHFYPYSWSNIHNPKAWLPIQYYHTWDNVASEYDGWAGIGTAFAIFIFFGLNNDAIDIYRNTLVKLGFGMMWPTLKEPRQQPSRRCSNDSGSSWHKHFDVVGKAVSFIEKSGSRKNSQATSTSLVHRIFTAFQSRQSSREQIHLSTTSNKPSHIDYSNAERKSVSIQHITTPDDVITHAPSPEHLLCPAAPQPRGISLFSTFQTHRSLPSLALIHEQFQRRPPTATIPSSKGAPATARTAEFENADLGAQGSKEALDHLKPHANEVVSTTIWSSGPTPVGTPSPMGFDGVEEQNNGMKMGTRERREMARVDKELLKETNIEAELGAVMVVDSGLEDGTDDDNDVEGAEGISNKRAL